MKLYIVFLLWVFASNGLAAAVMMDGWKPHEFIDFQRGKHPFDSVNYLDGILYVPRQTSDIKDERSKESYMIISYKDNFNYDYNRLSIQISSLRTKNLTEVYIALFNKLEKKELSPEWGIYAHYIVYSAMKEIFGRDGNLWDLIVKKNSKHRVNQLLNQSAIRKEIAKYLFELAIHLWDWEKMDFIPNSGGYALLSAAVGLFGSNRADLLLCFYLNNHSSNHETELKSIFNADSTDTDFDELIPPSAVPVGFDKYSGFRDLFYDYYYGSEGSEQL